MTSTQYEELCRRHIAEAFGIPLDRVQSKHIPNPQRPGGAGFQHQIDLWWETGNESIQYLHIANAKWCRTRYIKGRGCHRRRWSVRRVDSRRWGFRRGR